MPDNQKVAAEKSTRRFLKFVKPILEKEWGVKIFPVEQEDNKLLCDLDMHSSIDYSVSFENGSRWLSSRVQDDNEIYDIYKTFTIRTVRPSGARTELEKIANAKKNNFNYPYYILQAYTSGDEKLNRFAVAKWEDALILLENGIYKEHKTGDDQIGQALFYSLEWSNFIDAGYDIFIYPPKPIINHQHEEKCYFEPAFPCENKPYHPLWAKEILKKWVTENLGTKEQTKRYIADLEWYEKNN
jgi:hypothetical protein